MKEDTKACNLTENEVRILITSHGRSIEPYDDFENIENVINRMNYLNKRLKEFKKSDASTSRNEDAQALASTVNSDGWASN